jgi:hypothetical protein
MWAERIVVFYYYYLVVVVVVVVVIAIELLLGDSSPYTSTDKTKKNKYT